MRSDSCVKVLPYLKMKFLAKEVSQKVTSDKCTGFWINRTVKFGSKTQLPQSIVLSLLSSPHYAKCYYIKLFFPSPPKKQIYVCRMPYLVWFWVYWFMKHGLSDLKIKIKSWKILFFEDNFGNLGDKWVQLFFFFGQNSMGNPFLGSDFNFTIPNLVLS